MKKLHVRHIWLVFGAYGVWFAIFSGIEEITKGKWWKFIISLILGLIVYYVFENKMDNLKKK